MPVALLPQRLEHLEGGVGVRRALHVDAHEEAIGAVKNPSHVVDRRRPIDAQSELRELERQVAFDAGAGDRVDDPQVVEGGGVGLREAGDAFAEVIERLEQALRLDGSGGGDGFVDALRRR